MADTKVTGLTELSAKPAADDWLYIVDKSDTTDDAAGSSRKIAISNLAPTENVILTATKTSGQNINGVEGTESDLTWDVVAQDTGELTSFTTGDSKVIFTNAGWLNIHSSAYVTNGVVNNRSMWGLALYHYNTSDALQYSYHGDMQYNRDDNAVYDASGGYVNQCMMYVAAGDYIYIRTRVFDDGTSGTAQTLDTTYSKLRISQIVF